MGDPILSTVIKNFILHKLLEFKQNIKYIKTLRSPNLGSLADRKMTAGGGVFINILKF